MPSVAASEDGGSTRTDDASNGSSDSKRTTTNSFVLETFNKIHNWRHWTVYVHRDGHLNLETVDVTDKDNDDGTAAATTASASTPDKAVHADYQIVQTESWGGSGQIIVNYDIVPVSCVGADYLELEIRVLEAQSNPGKVQLRIVVLDDSDTTDLDALERYISFQNVLDEVTDDWRKLQIPLFGDRNPESPLYLPAWSGGTGNGVLDLNHIRGWSIEFSISNEGGIGTTSQGQLLFKHMSCVQAIAEEDDDEKDDNSTTVVASEGELTTTSTFYGTILDGPFYLPNGVSQFRSDDIVGLWWQDVKTVVGDDAEAGSGTNNATTADQPPELDVDTTLVNGTIVSRYTNIIIIPVVVPDDNGTAVNMNETDDAESGGSSSSTRTDTDSPTTSPIDGEQAATTTTHVTYEVSLQYQAHHNLHFDLTDDVTSLLLDIEWIPDRLRSNQVQEATVQLTLIGHDDDCYYDPSTYDGDCSDLNPRFTSKELHSIHPLVPTKQFRFSDFEYHPAEPEADKEAAPEGDDVNATSSPTASPRPTPTLNWRRIKGYRITLTVSSKIQPPGDEQQAVTLLAVVDDSDGDGSSASNDISGTFRISNFQTEIIQTYDPTVDDSTDDGNDSSDQPPPPTCRRVQGIYPATDVRWTLHPFLGSQCCDVCLQAGKDCMYFMVASFQCYTTPYLDFVVKGDAQEYQDETGNITISNSEGNDADSTPAQRSLPIKLADSENFDNNLKFFWKDDAQLRGDFCDVCRCNEQEQSIDCRGQDLIQIPQTFTLPNGLETAWKPKLLDLQDNPRLFVLGADMLSPSTFSELTEIRLPHTMVYVVPDALGALPNLETVQYEVEGVDPDLLALTSASNHITDLDERFSNICCSLGETFTTSSSNITFCNMEYFLPGIDATYLPFVHFSEAPPFATLVPSSSFMAEAAESPEKCAEYCAIAKSCRYFQFDARVGKPEYECRLLSKNGTNFDYECCDDNDYTDVEKTGPGYVAGYPALTRHTIDNTRVMFLQTELTANRDNNFTAQYQIKLGAQPRRGAVWIDPSVSSPPVEHFEVEIEPSRIALYDNMTTATVTIRLKDVKAGANGQNILIANSISSCDTAFTATDNLSLEGIIYVTVERKVPSRIIERITNTDDDNTTTILIGVLVPAAVICLAIAAYMYVEHKKRLAESVWQIKSEELKFDDPAEIIGQGTFGLVLLAEYRGTQVAVKRVLPASASSKSNSTKSGTTSSSLGVWRKRSGKSKNDNPIRTSIFGTGPSFHSGGSDYEEHEENSKRDERSTRSETDDTQTNEVIDLEAGKNSGTAEGSTSGTRSNHGLTSGSISTEGRKTARRGMAKMSTHFATTRGTAKLQADFISEMKYLSKLRHPNITTVMGAVLDRNDPLLVMEYMDHGSLHDVLHNETMVLEGEQILPILKDITLGLRFLHAADPQVIHGDLKSQNILIDNRFCAKVADFGLSQKKRLGATGTPYWMAPELLRKEKVNSATTDVYSFGVILYEIYSRADPYEGEDYEDVLRLVADPSVCKRPGTPSESPTLIRTLMGKCLEDKAEARPTFEDLHRSFKDCDISEIEPTIKRTSLQQRRTTMVGKRTEDLLHGVFPRHIAAALKAGRKVEPESHDLVTIFFSDIVGFTTLAATMTPLQISNLLDRLYHAFDELSELYDVFKVETIGDAYMACSNLVTKQEEDHAVRIALFAIDAVEAANKTLIDPDDPSRGTVSIRVGFHSGAVVANVVGSRNPRYCLFGDTVNTASRMESHSMKNRIHCSERAAKLLHAQDEEINVALRGNIEIKGKGKMKTYWVNEAKQTRPSFAKAPSHDRLKL